MAQGEVYLEGPGSRSFQWSVDRMSNYATGPNTFAQLRWSAHAFRSMADDTLCITRLAFQSSGRRCWTGGTTPTGRPWCAT